MFSKSRFVVAGCVVAVALAACGARVDTEQQAPRGAPISAERVESVGLHLQPVSGVTLTSIHYVVTKGEPGSVPPPAVVAEGNLPSPGTGETLTFGIPLPVGTHYFLSITAESAEAGDDITCSGSANPFSVSPNQGHAISVVLTCVDNSNGQSLVDVDVATDACPRLIVDYAIAEPAVAGLGSSLNVHAGARDLDGRPVTYVWSIVNPAQAAVGQFAPADAANTGFTCASSGDTVAVRVTATNGECSNSLQTSISCVADLDGCGNGVVGAGESCDTALDPTCPADCTRVCGDGVVELGEGCDPIPANPLVCYPAGHASECQARMGDCNDGVVTAPEPCDPLGHVGPGNIPLPSGSYCAADCSTVKLAHCGNGDEEPGEQCEPTSDLGCSDDCQQLFSPACVQCELAGDCFALVDSCLGPAGSFTQAQQALCWDVAACFVQTGCVAGSGSLAKCYCGTLSPDACGAAPFDLSAAGAPNGPCAAVMQLGNPGVVTNPAILGSLTSISRPAGFAGQRLRCQKADPVCAPICGLQ